jgi:hypothetical protein
MKCLRITWRLWCKALGEKASNNDSEADKVALIRTFIFATYLITNIAIVANAIRHWNDGTQRLPVQHQPIEEKHSQR